jgi:putative FmdB family regulatory protein
MPLFEFACRACGHHFEYLTREGRTPTCPSCAGVDLDKQLSVFAVSTSGAAAFRAIGADDAPVSPCGSCGDPRGAGACSIN